MDRVELHQQRVTIHRNGELAYARGDVTQGVDAVRRLRVSEEDDYELVPARLPAALSRGSP